MENLRNPRVLGTQYRVYDKDGKYKRTIDKTDEKNLDESDWLKGVTCFVINEKGEVLIEVRANKGLTPGKNDLCSGHLDNDETETQAMVRELKEELGINLEESMNVVKVTQQGVPLGFESSKKIKNFFITFYCLKRNSSKIEIQKEEIDKYVWLPLEETFQLLKCCYKEQNCLILIIVIYLRKLEIFIIAKAKEILKERNNYDSNIIRNNRNWQIFF